jgi:hypothetical protein
MMAVISFLFSVRTAGKSTKAAAVMNASLLRIFPKRSKRRPGKEQIREEMYLISQNQGSGQGCGHPEPLIKAAKCCSI